MHTSRLLLTKIRAGDYVHPGEAAAVDLVLDKILSFDPSLKNAAVLDVGCSFGGTANYLFQKGFKDVHGVDIDSTALRHAKEKYPEVNFIEENAFNIDKIYSSSYFSFIYLFSVIYAIEDKKNLLERLAAVAKPGALLAIFDYTCVKQSCEGLPMDLGKENMYPLYVPQITQDLEEVGWEVLEVRDLTSQFVGWYEKLLEKLAHKAPLLKKDFSKQDISTVKSTFAVLVKQLTEGLVGGAVIYARKK